MTTTRAEFLTEAEVSALLHIPRETLRWWRWAGRGPKSFKAGKRVLYAREDVDAFIAEARGHTA
jgi:hypothetical protein